ncbi:aspartate kinase [Paenibacillus albiflavus]|uniref:Aspartokinase n=1 Tax=Paenibacillus albiflavus TaxID=2545760 RepID=A0A4R4EIN4_9BACL|nr:aspartate kinase [Paenibacillus albiflavus]TCZ80016.1 aspartate kinase [Paenibacillus albiflavus]
MRILVQKFGGTSLSTIEARQHVIGHIKDALEREYKLVIVVSAMGRLGDPYATDTLLGLVSGNGKSLPAREKDMLLCCGEIISATNLCSQLQAEGISSVVMTGGQAGIQTNNVFGNAQIVSIDTSAIIEYLNQDQVVIVTGFQGMTASHEYTTLGRGGSDTSATALGAALRAEIVDIFTDVNGILTADPRIVEDAKPLTQVSFVEICNMAQNGAKVIHPRAVEVAMQANIPVRVRSTFSKDTGTLVTSTEAIKADWGHVADRFVTGIAHTSGVTQIQVGAAEQQYDLQLKVFKTMAQHHISVDFINVNPSGVVYTVYDSEAERAIQLLREAGFEPKWLSGCAKVAVIGGGINGVPGIMAHIVEALTEEDIQILQSADSNTTIWVLVSHDNMIEAVRALHRKFELNK